MAERPLDPPVDPDVDRYVRDQLGPEEEAAFEERLMSDPGLQAEVEAALAIRSAFELEQRHDDAPAEVAVAQGNPWTPYAMAASVALAVISTLMYWQSSVETGELREQLSTLQGPQAGVLPVSVPIMRSTGGSPDAIIQRPASGGVLRDIELSQRFHDADQLSFTLAAPGGETILSWQSGAPLNGRTTVLLPSAELPDGRVELRIAREGAEGETRLLEFR